MHDAVNGPDGPSDQASRSADAAGAMQPSGGLPTSDGTQRPHREPGGDQLQAVFSAADLEITLDERVNYAQHECEIAVVKSILLTNPGPYGLRKLQLKVSSEDPAIRPGRLDLGSLNADASLRIEAAQLNRAGFELSGALLRQRSERQRAVLSFDLQGECTPPEGPPPPAATEGPAPTAPSPDAVPSAGPVQKVTDRAPTDGSPSTGEAPSEAAPSLEAERLHFTTKLDRPTSFRQEHREDIEVLAWNEWAGTGGLPEVLAAFILPNDPVVARLVASARGALRARVGDDSFDGYQREDPSRCLHILGALYDAALSLDLGYLSIAPSFERTGQRILLPEHLDSERQGNCLDLSLLLAAAAERAGLNPLIFLVDGHAMMGVWTLDRGFEDAVEDSASRVLNRVGDAELSHILPLEATALTKRGTIAFDEASRLATRTLREQQASLVTLDVKRARALSYRPLATQVRPTTGETQHAANTSVTAGAASALLPAQVIAADEAKEQQPPRERTDRWKEKLLDLSLRNRLLNFKVNAKTIPLLIPDLSDFEDELQRRSRFRIAPPADLLKGVRSLERLREKEGADVAERSLLSSIAQGEVPADHREDTLEKRLNELRREARNLEQESGSNNLFLTLGALRWQDGKKPKPLLAPIILIPIQLVQRNGKHHLELTGEDPRANTTLLYKLRTEYGIETAGLEELPPDDHGIDLRRVLATLRDRIKDQDGWGIANEAYIGLFQFSKFVLWRDLEDAMPTFERSPVVRALLSTSDRPQGKAVALPTAADVDRGVATLELTCPLDADSSQLAAVLATERQQTFVLQGPPGTGKSQTITNIIAHALARGRRVLFVAEKAAALEVVHSRLKAVGLGEACLAVKPSKASKPSLRRDVVAQLQAAIDAKPEPAPAKRKQLLRELKEVRDQLNAYVTVVHAKHATGLSFHEALGEAAARSSAPQLPEYRPRWDAIDAEGVKARHLALEQLQLDLGPIAPPAEHPCHGTLPEAWEPALEDRLMAAAEDLQKAHEQLQEARQEWLRDSLNLDATSEELHLARLTPTALQSELELLALQRGGPQLSSELLEAPAPTALLARCRAAMKLVARVEEQAKDLLTRWQRSFLQQNPQEHLARCAAVASASFLTKPFKKRALRGGLEIHRTALGARGGEDLRALSADLHALDEHQQLQARARVEQEFLQQRFPDPSSERGRLDDAAIEAQLSWIASQRPRLEAFAAQHPAGPRLRAAFARTATQDGGPQGSQQPLAERLDRYERAHQSFQVADEGFRKGFHLEDEIVGSGPEASACEWIPSLTTRLLAGRSALRAWCRWSESVRRLRELDLNPILKALRDGEVPPEGLAEAFDRSVAEGVIRTRIEQEPALRSFSRERHEGLIKRFHDLDQQLLELNARHARAAVLAARPDMNRGSAASPERFLEKQLRLQRNHKALRVLFQEAGDLIGQLTPCLLMSPLAVARDLTPEYQADLVIFDEASQIPVPDAIGALGRAATAVIVGDSKQLPPTAFFGKGQDEEDDELLDHEDLESILDECSSADLPQLSLDWHYRSRHESLIAFSNSQYYKERLNTFPTAAYAAEGLGLHHVHVADATYDRSKSSTNAGEARAIVDELVRRCERAPQDAPPSVGVIAFSKSQAEFIEDLVDREASQHPALKAARECAEDALFVKNLENVQGDERDIIFFSICYGPDSTGKTTMHFGPINLQGGERRLNVAITRARHEMVVFSRLRARDIDLRRTSSVGAAQLRAFLEFAETGELIESAASPRRMPSSAKARSLPAALLKRLREAGHAVDASVGRSPSRVDLAVRDPEDPKRYSLGILCDGDTYRGALSARDRDRLRPSVLRNLHWTLEHTWTPRHEEAPAEELERLEAAIAEANAAAAARRAAAVEEARQVAAAIPAAPTREGSTDPEPEEQQRESTPAPYPEERELRASTVAERATASAAEPATQAALSETAAPAQADEPSSASDEAPAPEATTAGDYRKATTRPQDAPLGASAPPSPPSPATAGFAPSSDEPPSPPAGSSQPTPAGPVDLGLYEAYSETASRLTLETEQRPLIASTMLAIIEAEAPITTELLHRRCLHSFGTERRSQRYLSLLATLHPELRLGAFCDADGVWWRRDQDPSEWRGYRRSKANSALPRSFEEVPVLEVANALEAVLTRVGGGERDEVMRETIRCFGQRNLGSKIRERALAAVHLLLAQGRAQEQGDRLKAGG